MLHRPNIKQFYLPLPIEGVKAAAELLYRTDLLWNTVVESLGNTPEAYFEEPEGKDSDENFDALVKAVCQVVVNGDRSLFPDYIPPEKVSQALPLIHQLPNASIGNRIDDMIRCYRVSKRRYKQKPNARNNGIPGVKGKSSTRHIRFSAGDFELIDRQLKLKAGPLSVTFEYPEFSSVDSARLVNVSLSRHKLKKVLRADMGLTTLRFVYCFTFYYQSEEVAH